MITIIFALITVVALYWYGTKNYKYWKAKGIKHDKPIPFVGNSLKNFLMQISLSDAYNEMYWKYPKEKFVGFYRALRPELIVRDPEIVKRILTTDFMNFHVRGIGPQRNAEPLFQNVFFSDGDIWRLLRQRMTPAFSSGKLKAMFPLIIERAEKLKTNVLNAASEGRITDARDMMARFTTDFIGACGFGLEMDTLTDDNSPFRQLGKKIFTIPKKQLIIAMLKITFPNLMKNFTLRNDIKQDMHVLVHEILKKRNYKPSGRNDFIDLLLECKAKGTLMVESIENFKPDGTPEIAKLEMDDDLIAAQVLVFFAAGFETSSSATSFTLHQLAYHPDKQRKVQAEIDTVLAKHDNKLSYEAIKEMTYLECCFKESLRMFPSVGFLMRRSVGKYTFSDTDLTIDKGVVIVVPLQALQNDSQYFENPEQYRPERFLPEEFDNRSKFIFLPFGLGPRSCIGERLGLMQSLAGLAAVLSCSSVEPGPTTVRHPEVDPKSGLVQTVKSGLPLIFRKRDNVTK